jgi:PAS domain S-box-containing protein
VSYVTVIWSVVGSGSLLLALMYGLVWFMDRQARTYLAFTFVALSIAATVVVELGTMHSSTAAEWGEWIRWSQVPIFVHTVALLAFIRTYFDAGRDWLMWIIITMRAIVLITGFMVDPNFNFARIDSIVRIPFLGETVAVVGQAVVSPYQWFATMSTYLVPLFIADASVTVWRRGTPDARRCAVIIGGSVVLAWLLSSTTAQLMIFGVVKLPALISPPELIVLLAMTSELSRDTLRSSLRARELRESETRLQLAASAAGLGLWAWDVARRQIWATPATRDMVGLGRDEPIEVERLRQVVHPDDVESVRSALGAAANPRDERELHFRIIRPDGSVRWMAARGRSETDGHGQVSLVRGVLRDETEQFKTRQENEELRRDLAHAGRVSVLGTLSSSLAHELSQPLSAILLNTRSANLMLDQPHPDLAELRHILDDIQRDDRRAAEVIDRLRSLLKRRELEVVPVQVESLLQETATLLQSDAVSRKVSLEFRADAGLPTIRGDKVHLSQVLINLVINGMDAVSDMPPGLRRVSVQAYSAEKGWVGIDVRDNGSGFSAEALERTFEPFYTTKASGMGIGLSVSSTIVDAHAGRIWAENAPGGGAVVRVLLPLYE